MSKPVVQTNPSEVSSPVKKLSPALYIVATPIGNLSDITLRALETLRAVDAIACEDTRTTQKLLNHYGISTATISYHDHTGAARRERILQRIEDGDVIALVSDAGTPLISDPGYRLVSDARARGIAVVPIPGASSVLAALSASGLPTDRFMFIGFLPNKSKALRDTLRSLSPVQASLVMLESPRRVQATLAAMAEIFGDRHVTVAREITKRFEEFRSGPLPEVAAHYRDADTPRGEIVLVVGPKAEAEASDGDDGEDPGTAQDIEALIQDALKAHGTLRDAVANVVAITGEPRRKIYQAALKMTSRPDGENDGGSGNGIS